MSQRWKFSNRYHEGDFEAGTIWMDPLSSTASDADSWKGTGSCIPPLRLRTAAARHWMVFFSSLLNGFHLKKRCMEMYGGKLWERPQSFVCVYIYICIYVVVCVCVRADFFPDAVESLCVSGTNWTHTLLDGAADMYPVANLQCTIFPLTEALPGKACPKRSTIASLRLLILPLFSHLVATWWSATVWALLWIDLIS